MNQYPLVFIPEAIRRTRRELTVQPIAPKPPQRPQPEPQTLKLQVILLFAAIGLLLSIGLHAIISQSRGVAVGASIPLFPLIPLSVQKNKKRRKVHKQKIREKNEYLLQKKEYQAKLLAYISEYRNWQEKVRGSREKLMKALNQTRPPDGSGSQAKKGSSEERIEPYLHQYFSGKIHIGLKMQNPEYSAGRHYTPDFAYIDPVTNLHIDIEIDEPYAYGGDRPLHYIGKKQDKRRDEFFTDSYWVVVRFSEEQVIRYPESCCKKIAEVIADVISDESILKNFANIPPLPPMPRWTVKQAKRMAKSKYRQTYLKS